MSALTLSLKKSHTSLRINRKERCFIACCSKEGNHLKSTCLRIQRVLADCRKYHVKLNIPFLNFRKIKTTIEYHIKCKIVLYQINVWRHKITFKEKEWNNIQPTPNITPLQSKWVIVASLCLFFSRNSNRQKCYKSNSKAQA